KQVCEGQQLDMDFSQKDPFGERKDKVGFDHYLEMINLKTSVLLAASLKMGAILGGAGERNQNLIYEFGRKLGLAFQVQDDYLDAFGNPEKFGKQIGGDILANKKTFLLIHVLETASVQQKQQLQILLNGETQNKVQDTIQLFKECKVDEWARKLKERFVCEAFAHLEDIAVLSKRKEPLREFALFLVQRES
ncbi:MAG: polyprenyl synthetase family protein, partial [Chitinophagaceae bacterium]